MSFTDSFDVLKSLDILARNAPTLAGLRGIRVSYFPQTGHIMPLHKNLAYAVMFICFLGQVCTHSTAQPTQNARENQHPSQIVTPVVGAQQQYSPPNLRSDSKAKQDQNDKKIIQLSSAKKTVWDWVSYWANILLSIGGVCGIVIAILTLRSIQKQTTAMEKQVEHLLASARPWLLIKATGDGKIRVTFTAHNTGNSPAQIVWRDPLILGHEVPVNGSLPPIPVYWSYTEGNELVNSIWVEPGGKEEVAIFDSFDAFPHNSRLMVYSMIRYRNTFDETVHESRFCYRISNGVFAMDGPLGYNKNT